MTSQNVQRLQIFAMPIGNLNTSLTSINKGNLNLQTYIDGHANKNSQFEALS